MSEQKHNIFDHASNEFFIFSIKKWQCHKIFFLLFFRDFHPSGSGHLIQLENYFLIWVRFQVEKKIHYLFASVHYSTEAILRNFWTLFLHDLNSVVPKIMRKNPFMYSGFTDIFRRFFGFKIIMVTPGCQW